MPKGVYDGFVCKGGVSHQPFVPQPHQQKTVDAFVESKHKGMLLYHKLGSGKTCTTIMVGDRMLREQKVRRIYILTPGSLRKGWVNEYCSVCGYNNKLLSLYTFITYNYMVGTRLPNFDYSLVIIDEVHNLINGVKNKSKTPSKIYDAIMSAKCRVLALSGTPVYNSIHEWALLGNLLKPNTFPEIRRGKDIDSFAFIKDFNIEPDGTVTPKNPTRFNRDLDGIISFFPGSEDKFMPKVIEQPIVKVEMNLEQEGEYWASDATEKQFSSKPSERLARTDPQKYKLLEKLYIMARKNILTRASSNFHYPQGVDNEAKAELAGNAKMKDLPIEQGGWIEKKVFSGNKLRTYSMKFVAVLSNIILHLDQKQVVFTYFKNKSGVNLLKSLLGMCGVIAEVFSGDMNDEERGRTLTIFNSAENRHGEKIKVLLITEAGAEGISLMEVRHLHILESSPRVTKINQVVGRVARFKSHINLPKSEQNVRIWRYWSVTNDKEFKLKTQVYNQSGEVEDIERLITNKTCIDQILYERGVQTMNQLNSFLKLLQRNSIL